MFTKIYIIFMYTYICKNFSTRLDKGLEKKSNKGDG